MVMEVPIAGELAGCDRDSLTIRVTSIVPFLILKGMALEDRLKEKDSWDIYYSVINYPGRLDALVEVFKPYLNHGAGELPSDTNWASFERKTEGGFRGSPRVQGRSKIAGISTNTFVCKN